MAFPIAGPATSPVLYPVGGTANSLQATGFIPEIWSGKLIEKFYASTVLSAISNTDYEGEIKNQGDKVRIRTKPTITIKDYRADGLLELERPSGNIIDLLIDQGKYFNTILDDVMDVQSDINNLSLWSDDAGEQMKLVIDTQVLRSLVHAMPTPANRGIAAGAISATVNLGVSGTPLAVVSQSPTTGQVTPLDVIIRMGLALDEQNIPETGRWVVMPTWMCATLKLSELRQAYLTGDAVSPLRNGRLGMIDRFTIYGSNLLPKGVAGGVAAGEWVVFAGHAHGLTFASQISKIETMRSELTFGNILRGLQVFGSKVLDGTALVEAIVTKV